MAANGAFLHLAREVGLFSTICRFSPLATTSAREAAPMRLIPTLKVMRLSAGVAEQRLDVKLDGVRRNAEAPGHCLVGQPVADSGEHLDFTGCQNRRRLFGQCAKSAVWRAHRPHAQSCDDGAPRRVDLVHARIEPRSMAGLA